MEIRNRQAIDAVRNCLACMLCRRYCCPDPHHLWTKGSGGPECEWSLVPLCRECHTKYQGDQEVNDQLKAIVAKRFNCTVTDMTRARHLIDQLKKEWDRVQVAAHLKLQSGVTKAARSLVWLAWEERET